MCHCVFEKIMCNLIGRHFNTYTIMKKRPLLLNEKIDWDKDLGCSVRVNITTSCVWFISFTMEGCNLMRNRNIKEIEETQIWGWDSVFNVFALYFVLCPLQLNNSFSFCHCFGNWKIYLLIRDESGNTSSFASL